MTKYLDDDGTGVKPRQFFSRTLRGEICWYGSNHYSSRGKMWDRNMKNLENI